MVDGKLLLFSSSCRLDIRILCCGLLLIGAARGADEAFFIQVVDEEARRGVPLVELTTVHGLHYVTDNGGWIAVDDTELFGESVFFHIASHGYHYPKDGFGYSGARLGVQSGVTKTLTIKRDNLAERLYRITGAGQYVHTLKAGKPSPVNAPLLPSQVTGCDSVQNALYRGKLFWIWGDTNRLRYPLGNFQTTGATSILPRQGGLSPDVGINLDYFQNEEGFVKGIAPMPGKGPTWLSALVTLPDAQGVEQLGATYVKIEGFLKAYERGLCVFNPDTELFEKALVFKSLEAPFPDGHACIRDGHVYFGQATPNLRTEARHEAWLDPESYETITTDVAFADAKTEKPIKAHHGHCAWNPYRKAWVSIFTQKVEPIGPFGEIYYAEAPQPSGPWRKAIKILTHSNYTFYNPAQHPWFSTGPNIEASVLYFEGTFTKFFANRRQGVPRYDYNQIMYRLDLDAPEIVDTFGEKSPID